MNGMEGMLKSLVKSLGLQPLLDAANELATNGTVQKITRMVDEWDETQRMIRALYHERFPDENGARRGSEPGPGCIDGNIDGGPTIRLLAGRSD